MLNWKLLREKLVGLASRQRGDDFRKWKKGVHSAHKSLFHLDQIQIDPSDPDVVSHAFLAGAYYGWATKEGDLSIRNAEQGSMNRKITAQKEKLIVENVHNLVAEGLSKRNAVGHSADTFDVGESTIWNFLKKADKKTL